MIVGSKLTAPEGFRGMARDVEYYFLVSNGTINRVRLVFFDVQGSNAHLLTLSRLEFESALINGDLVENGVDAYPPWLESIKGISISYLEQRRVNPKESYDQKVNARFLAIAELVEHAGEILVADKPEAIINACAKNQSPSQNAARLKFWFFSYLVFGRNKWALMPRLASIGTYQRDQRPGDKVLGRPSGAGRRARFPATAEMKLSVLEGFIAHNDKRKTIPDIFGDVLSHQFGCLTRVDKNGVIQFYHPEGKPFPTITQFKHWVAMQTEAGSLKKARKGVSGARAASGSKGSFSHYLMNVNQLVEFDGYNPKGKISGLLEGSAVDSFCVVRGVCALSGAVVAIGFSENKENMEAYRMALFSMAVGKVKYASLFGTTLTEDDWSCYGLPLNVIFDRGPGSTMGVSVRSDEMTCEKMRKWLSRLELTPTHSGQSKATVESSHPRTRADNDQPTYFHSSLNYVQMCKRHIYQVVLDNRTSDATSRMIPDMLEVGFTPSPANIHRYYSDIARDSGTVMLFEDAVREFLTPHQATIKKGGVYFLSRRYNSTELVATNVFDGVATAGQIKVTAYVMVMCVRHIWIELNGVLYELDFIKPASVHPGSVDISLSDLQELDALRLQISAQHKEEQSAIAQDVKSRFLQEAGMSWDGGLRKPGRPAKDATVQRDTADFKRMMGKGHD